MCGRAIDQLVNAPHDKRKPKNKKKQGRQVVAAAAYENVITKLTSGTFTAAAHAQQLNLVWSRGLDAPLGR